MTNNKSKIVNIEEYILDLFRVEILSVPKAKNEAKYISIYRPSVYNFNDNISYDNHIIKEKMNEFKESLETFNENLYFNYMVKSAMICGKKSVLTHHLVYKSIEPKLCLNINNGIPLCKKCIMKFMDGD